MSEVWKPIKGYEGIYEVSSYGRVKSLARIAERERDGYSYNVPVPERILTPRKNKCGYYRVRLSTGHRQMKDFFIHQLVAIAFIPNPKGFPIVNHKDENPKNNRVENLEWCDCIYNNNYGTRNQRISKANSMAVVQMDLDGNDIREFDSIHDAAMSLGGLCYVVAISFVCRGVRRRKTAGGYRWRYKE